MKFSEELKLALAKRPQHPAFVRISADEPFQKTHQKKKAPQQTILHTGSACEKEERVRERIKRTKKNDSSSLI